MDDKNHIEATVAGGLPYDGFGRSIRLRHGETMVSAQGRHPIVGLERWALVLTIGAVVAGCGGSSGSAGGGGKSEGMPEPRTGETALLAVLPPRLVLAPGETAQVEVVELASDGTVAPFSGVSWALEGLEVTLDASTGTVTAMQAGTAQIQAYDTAGNRMATTTVEVVDTPSSGPASLRFEPAALGIAVGESASFTVEVLDGRGMPIPETELELRTTGTAGLTVEGGMVRGDGPGFGLVQGAIGGEPLAGGLPVSVARPRREEGASSDVVTGCGLVEPPVLLTEPSQSSPVVVLVSHAHYDANGSLVAPYIDFRLEHPTRIEVKHRLVATASSAGISGSGAGHTSYRAFVGEEDCGSMGLAVAPQMAGNWRFDCKDGRQGTAELDFWPSTVYRDMGLMPSGAINASRSIWLFRHELTGSSCVGRKATSICEDEDAVTTWDAHFGSCIAGVPREGPCTSSNPCCGVVLPLCDAIGPLEVIGFEKLRAPGCTFEWGAGECLDEGSAPPPPEGDGCFDTRECESGICNKGYRAITDIGSPTDGTCRSASTAGEACLSHADCTSGLACFFSSPMAYCFSDTARGECRQLAATGAPCDCNAQCESMMCSSNSGGTCQ